MSNRKVLFCRMSSNEKCLLIFCLLGLSDLASGYKINPSSNTDLPSPSSSSNSSNPPSSSQHPHPHHLHQHHPTKRHGEGNDPTRKREMRLQKNR